MNRKTYHLVELPFKMNDLNADESRNLVFQIHVPKIKTSDDQSIGE